MSTETEVFDFSSNGKQNDFDKFIIDLSEDIKEPVPLISVGGVPVFTRGNISCISGKAKARKTFLIGLFASQFLELSDSQKILILDTEQSFFHVQKATKRIHKLLGWDECRNNQLLKVFALRELNPEQRTEFVKNAIEYYRPDLVFLDGVRDLLHDFNNITESSDLVGLLMKLSSEINCHICAVLHENKGDNNLRGHSGTELMNKAETVISVSKPPDCNYSTVEPKVSRNIAFEKFHFTVDENGLPQLCNPQTVKIRNNDKLKTVFGSILTGGKTFSYSELKTLVMENCKVKDRAAETRISTAVESGFIIKNSIGYYYLASDSPEPENETEMPF